MVKTNKKIKKLPSPQYFSAMAEIEIVHLDEMTASIDLYLEGIRDDIKARIEKVSPEKYDSEHDYLSHMDSLHDELVQMNEVENISKKLLSVGLYMIVESFIKKIMKWVYQGFDAETRENKLRSLHRWENLKEDLRDFCGFNLSEVSGFSTINELRLINNVVKHSGYVDKKLAAFPLWRGEISNEIDVSLIELKKFRTSIPKFIRNLVERINNS